MNKYETVFIINTNISEEESKKVINKVEKYISENGTINQTTDLGNKRLAYQVKGQDYGRYYVIEFEAQAETIYELERLYRITEEIMKFIVVKKED